MQSVYLRIAGLLNRFNGFLLFGFSSVCFCSVKNNDIKIILVEFVCHIYVTHSQSVDGRAEPAILAVFGEARWFEL